MPADITNSACCPTGLQHTHFNKPPYSCVMDSLQTSILSKSSNHTYLALILGLQRFLIALLQLIKSFIHFLRSHIH